MSQNFNLAIARGKVHEIMCRMRKIEIEVDRRGAQTDRDLAEHRRLQRELEDAEHEAWLERIVVLCNTPCWRFRVV